MAFHGMVQVYTGNGKGKTTAALGLALRAAGWGYRTYIAQFMKSGRYGELRCVQSRLAEWITIEQFGLPGFHHAAAGVRPEERRAAEAGLRGAARALAGGDYRIVILDEINTLLHFRIVPAAEVLRLIDGRPQTVELVLTGRYAPPAILARADLVSEVRERRHYFAKGVTARRGIER